LAFRTGHGTFLKVLPAEGGDVALTAKDATSPAAMWELTPSADDGHISIRSVYGTYISCNKESQTISIVAMPFEDEMMTMERSGTRINFRCSNGMYVSASPDGFLHQVGGKQSPDTDFTLEPDENDQTAIRSSHKTYLTATRPQLLSKLSQSVAADESVAFIMDRGQAQAQFTIQSLHGTYLSPGQGSVGALRREDYHAMWGVSMGTGGTVCLRGTIKGQYLWALEDKKGVTMMPLCIEHSQLTPVVLSRGGHTGDDYDSLDLAQLLELERAYGGIDGDELRLQGADESAEDEGLGYSSLYPEEAFAQMQNNGYTYIDVRTEGEYARGHVPDAILIPSHVNAPGGREPDPEAFVAEIQRRFPDRQSKLVLGCRSGVRSKSAASWLVELGYSSILDLEGGWLLWSANPELPAWGERGEPPAPSA